MNRVTKCSKNFILDISYIYLIVSQASTEGEKNGPKFVEPIPNVTVTIGREASLPCVVSNLGTYKVMWIHIDRQMVVTIHKHVITRIPGYSITVSSNPGSNKNTWILRLARVQQEDRGYYMCQVNTNPVMSQVGYLQVTVPPVFLDDDSTSTSTVVVRENQNVTLRCRAQGFPTPKIAWKREDDRDIVLSRKNKAPVFNSESIHFEKVTRNDMAGYLCIAANGVPPALIKKIFINIEFSPIILVPNQLTASILGSTTVLQCQSEANPTANTYWIRDGHTLFSNSKYNISTSQYSYQTFTKLEIANTSREDLGEYTCLSKNSLGETEGTVRLYEYFTTASTEPLTSYMSTKSTRRISVADTSDNSKMNRSIGKTGIRNYDDYFPIYKTEKSFKWNSSSSFKGKEQTIFNIHSYRETIFNLGTEFLPPRFFLILMAIIVLLVF